MGHRFHGILLPPLSLIGLIGLSRVGRSGVGCVESGGVSSPVPLLERTDEMLQHASDSVESVWD